MTAQIAVLAVRFAVMAVVTFLATIIWSKFRDASWMLIVVGILAGYADILYSFLVDFGLMPESKLVFSGIRLSDFIFPNLPWLFFSAAFIVMLVRGNTSKMTNKVLKSKKKAENKKNKAQKPEKTKKAK